MKGRIWPVSWSQNLVCPLFQQPVFFCLHIDIPSEITAKYSTLTSMKNDHVKSVPFYQAYMLPVCKHMYSWFLRQRYHSSVNITKRNLECAPSLQISTKCAYQIFFSFMCSKALKVTRLHKCHCGITVLGKGCVPRRLWNERTTVCY